MRALIKLLYSSSNYLVHWSFAPSVVRDDPQASQRVHRTNQSPDNPEDDDDVIFYPLVLAQAPAENSQMSQARQNEGFGSF